LLFLILYMRLAADGWLDSRTPLLLLILGLLLVLLIVMVLLVVVLLVGVGGMHGGYQLGG